MGPQTTEALSLLHVALPDPTKYLLGSPSKAYKPTKLARLADFRPILDGNWQEEPAGKGRGFRYWPWKWRKAMILDVDPTQLEFGLAIGAEPADAFFDGKNVFTAKIPNGTIDAVRAIERHKANENVRYSVALRLGNGALL